MPRDPKAPAKQRAPRALTAKQASAVLALVAIGENNPAFRLRVRQQLDSKSLLVALEKYLASSKGDVATLEADILDYAKSALPGFAHPEGASNV